MKLKFISDAYYNGEHKYHKGKSYEISNEFGEAFRWLKRGLAIEEIEVPVIVEEVNEIIEEPVLEVPTELPLIEENIVKELVKKDNVKGKKRKGTILNETSENL